MELKYAEHNIEGAHRKFELEQIDLGIQTQNF